MLSDTAIAVFTTQDDLLALLEHYSIANVLNAWTRMPDLEPQSDRPGMSTADFAVVRALLTPGCLTSKRRRHLSRAGTSTSRTRTLFYAMPDPRWPPIVIHDQKGLLAQRITAITLGYEDLNDHQTLRSDPALELATGIIPEEGTLLASPPTLCRLENRIDRKSLIRIAEVLVDQFIAAHPEPPEPLMLDFDATDDPVHD